MVGQNPFVCTACDFHFHFPPTVAVGALIINEQQEILFIERSKNPGKGLLGLPGGFVDAGETAEAAVVREIKEEVGLVVQQLEYLTTFPNVYQYKGVANDILDVFFVSRISDIPNLQLQASEVVDAFFGAPAADFLSRMAFDSNRLAIEFYQSQQS